MTLSEFLPIPDGNQNSIAMDWLTRWTERGNKPLSPATVESRFSELRNEKVDGIRFFYNDPAREALLAEVLKLSPEQRQAARGRAEDLLAHGGQQAPRLVLELAGLSADAGEADMLFQQIKRDFLGTDPVLPLVLVVDDLQYDRLPRSFDDLKPRLSYIKVGVGEARVKAEELAGEGAVLGRRVPFRPYNRWLAMDWCKKTLLYAPTAGPTQLRGEGRVMAPPMPQLNAASYLDDPAPEVKLPDDPLKLRALIDELGNPEKTADYGTLPQRVALAAALEVCAAALPAEIKAAETRRERVQIEAELTDLAGRLPTSLGEGGEAELAQVKQRASFQKVEPKLFRIGDILHLVGNDGLEVPTHPRLTVHRCAIQPTALQRLMEVTATMTLDDWRADPLLLKVIDQLAAGDKAERLRLLHARAGLVLSGALKPAAPKLVEDWRPALLALLVGNPPAAKLLPVGQADPVEWVERCVKLRPWFFPDGKMFLSEVKDCPPLYFVPPLTCSAFGRGEKLVWFYPVRVSYQTYYTYHEELDAPPKALVLVDPKLATDPETWMQMVLASPFLKGTMSTIEIWKKYQYKIQTGGELPDWNSTSLPLPENIWHQADRELATAWMALRRAVRQADAVQLHDGQVLLDLGGGVLADMQLRYFGGETDKVDAALELGWSRPHAAGVTLSPLTARVNTHLAHTSGNYISSLGYALPAGIHLTGQGMAVEIHFVASPLLSAAGPTPVVMAGVVGAVAAAADDEEDARNDD